MSDYTSKVCTKCHIEKPATVEYFSPDKKHSDGLRSECKECKNQRQNERRANDPEYREREKQQKKERYANDPEYRERVKAIQHKRRAVEGEYTTADVELQYRSQRGKCWHCGEALNNTFHIDHLIPLDKGGTNWPNNIVCSCKNCNLSKGAKMTYEWNGRLF